MAHDDWVLSVFWQQGGNRTLDEPLALLTASADKTLALWSPEKGGRGTWSSMVDHFTRFPIAVEATPVLINMLRLFFSFYRQSLDRQEGDQLMDSVVL